MIRIHYSEVGIRGSGSGSIQKFHGSATLLPDVGAVLFEDAG
jgi:hypothetical protein